MDKYEKNSASKLSTDNEDGWEVVAIPDLSSIFKTRAPPPCKRQSHSSDSSSNWQTLSEFIASISTSGPEKAAPTFKSASTSASSFYSFSQSDDFSSLKRSDSEPISNQNNTLTTAIELPFSNEPDSASSNNNFSSDIDDSVDNHFDNLDSQSESDITLGYSAPDSELSGMNKLKFIRNPKTPPGSDKNAKGKSGKDKIEIKEAESCPICLDDFTPQSKMKILTCSHKFCLTCIEEHAKNDYKCPICKAFFKAPEGNQPNGTMKVGRYGGNYLLPGFENDSNGVIVITYTFADGTQSKNHPNPGRPYHGTRRQAYLPDNEEGIRVLKLLEKAWAARLTFTIGTSVTTGTSDVVVWNGIHHKTNMTGGPDGFGYPDPTYLRRVTEELAAVGIFDDATTAGARKSAHSSSSTSASKTSSLMDTNQSQVPSSSTYIAASTTNATRPKSLQTAPHPPSSGKNTTGARKGYTTGASSSTSQYQCKYYTASNSSSSKQNQFTTRTGNASASSVSDPSNKRLKK